MKPELLSPAGSLDSLKAAVNAGADAVYIGGARYGARAYADNPDSEGLLKAIDYCHFHGRKMYLTLNTLMKESEFDDELFSFIMPLYREGLDAVIVQDFGIVSYIRSEFPQLPVHASTQMAVAGKYGAKLLSEMGVSRLVLPRELRLPEIAEVTELGGIETECFIHGALCYCYSGQCLMSSLIGGRSGNRGRCAQVCRLPFEGGHLLNLKDLNTLKILPDIIDTGVSSLKIEGRMKSPRYTAGVTSVYRRYIDMYDEKGREGYRVSPSDERLLRELFDRGGTTTGYFTRHNGKDMIFKGEKPDRIPDEKLLSRIDREFLESDTRVPLTGEIRLAPGEMSYMSLSDGTCQVRVTGDIVQRATTRPLTEDEVRTSASKFGDSPFTLRELKVTMLDGIFMPVSSINKLRRKAIESLEKEKINGYKRSNF